MDEISEDVFLICPPVSPFESRESIEAWIADLAGRRGEPDNPDSRNRALDAALAEARGWLECLEQSSAAERGR